MNLCINVLYMNFLSIKFRCLVKVVPPTRAALFHPSSNSGANVPIHCFLAAQHFITRYPPQSARKVIETRHQGYGLDISGADDVHHDGEWTRLVDKLISLQLITLQAISTYLGTLYRVYHHLIFKSSSCNAHIHCDILANIMKGISQTGMQIRTWTALSRLPSYVSPALSIGAKHNENY